MNRCLTQLYIHQNDNRRDATSRFVQFVLKAANCILFGRFYFSKEESPSRQSDSDSQWLDVENGWQIRSTLFSWRQNNVYVEVIGSTLQFNVETTLNNQCFSNYIDTTLIDRRWNNVCETTLKRRRYYVVDVATFSRSKYNIETSRARWYVTFLGEL